MTTIAECKKIAGGAHCFVEPQGAGDAMARLARDVIALQVALAPVAKEIRNKQPDVFHPTWNEDAHIDAEITLTVAECREILRLVPRGDGGKDLYAEQ